jgi:GTP-binding protein EngB required for normal cell division
MLKPSRFLRNGFNNVSRPRYRTQYGYFQDQAPRPMTATAMVDPRQLLHARRREPAVMLADAEAVIQDALALTQTSAELAVAPRADMHTALSHSTAGTAATQELNDDDFMYDDVQQLARDTTGAVCAVPKDAMDIVSDEFARLRQQEAERRRKLLYELSTPNKADYTFAGKLVPVPPISFGALSPEAYLLGHQMFLGNPYSLVRESPATDYFFEINDLYIEVAFIGRANAGKSSLVNALVGGAVAKTSSKPHSTRTVNFYQNASPEELQRYAGRTPSKLVKLPGGGKQFTLVDVPGFGIPGMSEQWRDDAIRLTDSYLGLRRSVNTVFMCVDADKGLTPTDLTYLEWLERIQGLVWIVVTQSDRVPHSRLCQVMNKIYATVTKSRRKFRNVYPFVLPVSAHTGANIDALRALIVETSGVVPGSKMREILRKKSHEALAKMNAEEQQRIERNRLEEQGLSITPGSDMGAASPGPVEHAPHGQSPDHFTLSQSVNIQLPHKVKNAFWVGGPNGKMKANLGLEAGDSVSIGSSSNAGAQRSAEELLKVIPADVLDRAKRGEHAAPVKNRVSHALCKLEEQRSAAMKGSAEIVAGSGRSTTVLFEKPDGSFVGTHNGKAIRAANVSRRSKNFGNKRVDVLTVESEHTHRHAAALQAAQRVAPSSPWAAIGDESAVDKMTPRDQKAYERYNGGHGMSQKRFWDEVDMKKVETDHRQVTGLRGDKLLEFSHASRVGWAQQPHGQVRKYGRKKEEMRARGASSVHGV